MTSAPLLVILGVGALGASLALLAASQGWARAADALAIGAALAGIAAFATAAIATVRAARRLPARADRR